MRIRSVAIAIIWLLPIAAYAQPKVEIALKAGPNAATIDVPSRTSTYGLSGGIAGLLQFSSIGRLQIAGAIEFLYTPRGAEAVFEGEYQGRNRLHYLDAAVTIRPGGRLGPTTVYLLLGSGINLLLSANQEDASGMKRDITDVLNRFDVTLLVGAGVALHLPSYQLGPFHFSTAFFEARHDRGLVETDSVNGGSRNRATSFMIGLSFSLGARAAPSNGRTDPSAPIGAIGLPGK